MSELAFDGGLNSFRGATEQRRTNAMFTEENLIDFKCPYCGELNSLPESFAGFARECVNCLKNLIMPKTNNKINQKLPIPITTKKLILKQLNTND